MKIKKVVYGSLFLALVGIGFIGCKKNSIERANNQNNITNVTKAKTSTDDYEKASTGHGRFVIIRCDRGRKKYGCTGSHWGLCNCKWFPEWPRKKSSIIGEDGLEYEELSANFYANTSTMDISSENFKDNGFDTMYVDEDIKLSTQVAKQLGVSNIIIKRGAYTRINPKTVKVKVAFTE